MAIVIAIFAMMIPFIRESKYPWPNEDGLLFFIRVRNQVGSYLPLLSTLIAIIPAALTYLLEKESGVSNYIFVRMRKKAYLRIKYITNMIIGGLALVIPQVIMIIFLVIRNGINNNISYDISGPFNSVFYDSKILYVLILLIASFVFGAVMATLSLGISALFQNKYLTIIIPYIYIIISGSIFYIIGINSFFDLNVVNLFCIYSRGNHTIFSYIVYLCFILIIGSILFFYNGEKKDEV